MSDFLDDEQRVADERDNEGLFESYALRSPLKTLPELQPVVGVEPQTSVRKAIQEMIDRRVGCVLVIENDKLAGVFSERDVLTKAVSNNIDLDSTAVSELMTADPETLSQDHELAFALRKMAVGGYRHVPLLNENGRPVAVVSMRDIVDFIVSLYQKQVLNLPDPDAPNSGTREGA